MNLYICSWFQVNARITIKESYVPYDLHKQSVKGK